MAVLTSGTVYVGGLGSPPPVTLQSLLLSSTTFSTAGTSAGAVLATISGQTPGSTVSISPSDTSGLFAVASGGTQLVAGLNFASASAGSVNVSLSEALPGASNTPHVTTIPATLTSAIQASSLRVVGNRGMISTDRGAPSTSYTTYYGRVRTFLSPIPVATFAPKFVNWFVPSSGTSTGYETVGYGPITINQLYAEYATAKVAMTWGGGQSFPVTLQPGDELIVDAITPASFGKTSAQLANAQIYFRFEINVASGNGWPCSLDTVSSLEQCLMSNEAPGTYSLNGTGTLDSTGRTSANGLGYSFIAVLGTWASTAGVSMGLVGDSITRNRADTPYTGGSPSGGVYVRGLESISQRGVTGKMPWMDLGVNSTTLQQLMTPGAGIGGTIGGDRRITLVQKHCDLGFFGHVTNDVQQGTEQQSDFTSAFASLYTRVKQTTGLKTIGVTCVPRTNSSDSWATPGNQSWTSYPRFAPGQLRDTLNTFIKASVGTSTGPDVVFDITPSLEDQSNPGKWVTSGGTAQYGSQEGVHPSQNGCGLASPGFTAVVAPLAT